MYTKNEHILEYPNYTSIQDFKDSLIYGKEIVILWKGIYFTIEYDEKTFSISEAYKPETERCFKTIDELLKFKLNSGDLLMDIITQAEVEWRNI
ncbi:MAG: hypothetical protein NC213_08150 [Acetobacter sp.]|nr:hypothetical protein [Bacteroides sp.]MCM1341701.1 hypothetical protein [Acetobacter sp.]MCM1432361.1 hypothetical protein [Clostridiales bacterium]